MASTDREILRTLAGEIKEIAERDEQREKARLWKTCNDLKPERPMVLANPQGGWADLDDQWIRRECVDEDNREIEHALRRIILRDRHIPDDFPVESCFRVEPVASGDTYNDYGIPLLATRPEEADGAYRIESMINGPEDMEKLRNRPVRIDIDETKRRVAYIGDLIGDILDVRLVGRSHWRYGLTRVLIHMRGFERMLLDLYENPGLIRSLMAFLRDDYLKEIETYERADAFGYSNYPQSWLGSGGLAYCSGLTEEGAADLPAVLTDNVAWGESQETVGVGPDQFDEFVLQYQLPLLERFGLVDYGCCEGLENKVDLIIDKIPNLRWIAVSPWADREKMADRIRGDYVYVYKPNPATICAREPSWESAESELVETLRIARKCPVHIVMKDTKTFHHDGERITRWCKMASELARGNVT